MTKSNAGINFMLLGIKTEQFALLSENYTPKSEIALSTAIEFKINEQEKQIGAFLSFEFIQKKKVLIKIEVSCHFKIKDNSWANLTIKNENRITVPKDFLAHLAMITTGTSRGILFAKTEGTEFSKFIIPTLNVAELIPNDAEFFIAPM